MEPVLTGRISRRGDLNRHAKQERIRLVRGIRVHVGQHSLLKCSRLKGVLGVRNPSPGTPGR
jgi:hypothetical protein